MQIIIAGCDRVGSYIARKLSEMGHDLVLMDEKSASLEALEDIDCLKIQGKIIDVERQRLAGAETADAFFAVSADEKMNVMAAEVAQIVHNVPLVIARTLNARNNEIYLEMGLDTVCTTRVVAERFIKKLVDGDRQRRVELFGHALTVRRETVLPQFVGHTVADLEQTVKRRIFALLRGNALLTVKSSMLLSEGDELLFAQTKESEV